MGSDDGVPDEEIRRGSEEMGLELLQVVEGRDVRVCRTEIGGYG